MEMIKRPFTTNTFQKIWKNHFIPNKPTNTFKFINGINFYKNRFFPLYFNIGKNLTKGNNYVIHDHKDYKKKCFVVYDVLPHLSDTPNNFQKNIGICKSNQYPGFLINLNKFNSIDEYLLETFSKNTRTKMRKFTRRLDKCFNISSKMFLRDINKDEYDELFDYFMVLLKKRYQEKQITYNNMQPVEWHFYKDVAYPLIREKKASLFVVYDNEKPIAITYNYHTEDSVIDAITVFDTDYSKFNIGYINNLKLLRWCFENNISTLDFSKGYFDYKKRMCTLEYNFEYHIIYDKKSVRSRLIAYSYYNFLEFKSYLRRKKLDVKFHKITYFIKNKKYVRSCEKVKVIKLGRLPHSDNLLRIDVKEDVAYNFLIKCVYDFLYLAIRPYEEIQVYKLNNDNNTYVLCSDSLIQQIKLI